MCCKKGVLRNFTKFTGKRLCQSLFFNKVAAAQALTLAQAFSCEFCEISKSTLFYRTHLVAASKVKYIFSQKLHFIDLWQDSEYTPKFWVKFQTVSNHSSSLFAWSLPWRRAIRLLVWYKTKHRCTWLCFQGLLREHLIMCIVSHCFSQILIHKGYIPHWNVCMKTATLNKESTKHSPEKHKMTKLSTINSEIFGNRIWCQYVLSTSAVPIDYLSFHSLSAQPILCFIYMFLHFIWSEFRSTFILSSK